MEAGLMSGTLFFDVSGKGYLPPRGVFVGEHHQDPMRRFLEIWVGEPENTADRPKFHNEMDKKRFLLWKNNRHDPNKHIEHKFRDHHARYSKILNWHAEQRKRSQNHPILRHSPKEVVNKMITENGLAVVQKNGEVLSVYSLKRQVPFNSEQQGRVQHLFGVDYDTMVNWAPHIGARAESVQAAVVVFGEYMYSQTKEEPKKPTPSDLRGTDAEHLNTKDGEIIIDEPFSRDYPLGAIGQDPDGSWYAVGLTHLHGRTKEKYEVPDNWKKHIPQGAKADKQEISDDPVKQQADQHLPAPPPPSPAPQDRPATRQKVPQTPMAFVKGNPGTNSRFKSGLPKMQPNAKIRGVS